MLVLHAIVKVYAIDIKQFHPSTLITDTSKALPRSDPEDHLKKVLFGGYFRIRIVSFKLGNSTSR